MATVRFGLVFVAMAVGVFLVALVVTKLIAMAVASDVGRIRRRPWRRWSLTGKRRPAYPARQPAAISAVATEHFRPKPSPPPPARPTVPRTLDSHDSPGLGQPAPPEHRLRKNDVMPEHAKVHRRPYRESEHAVPEPKVDVESGPDLENAAWTVEPPELAELAELPQLARREPGTGTNPYDDLGDLDVTSSPALGALLPPPLALASGAEAGPVEEPSALSVPPLRPPSARLVAAARTGQGQRRDNQDAATALPYVLAIADGVGGGPGGARAAVAAVRTVVRSAVSATSRGGSGASDLEHAAQQAHAEVLRIARAEPGLRGMACTLDVIRLEEDPREGLVLLGVHVGDSTVWQMPAGGRPHRLTTPHNDGTGRLLRMVGHVEEMRCDSWSVPTRAGDRIVMATDGLWADLRLAAVESLIHAVGQLSPDIAAHVLVETALRAGGSDNVSVIVADVTGATEALPAEIDVRGRELAVFPHDVSDTV